MEVFNIDDVTANDVIQRKQHRKEKKNLSSIVVYGYASMLVSLYYFDKKFTANFQPTFTFSKYE